MIGKWFSYFRVCFIVFFVSLLLSCKADWQQTIRWDAKGAPCSKTFVIHDSLNYWLYQWKSNELTLLTYKYYPRGYFLPQSAFVCEKNEVLTSWEQTFPPHDWGLTHVRGDGQVKDIIIDEGPGYFEQYDGHLMLHTTILKRDFDNFQSLPPNFWKKPDGTYQELLDYNVRTRKVEAKYYNPGPLNFMFHAGENMYIGTGWGMLWRINLKTKKQTMVYKPKGSFFYPAYAITDDERAFILAARLTLVVLIEKGWSVVIGREGLEIPHIKRTPFMRLPLGRPLRY